MTRWIFLIFLGAAGLRANTCAAPIIDDVTHQGARVQWQSDVTAVNQRIQYGTTSSYGYIQGVYSAFSLAPHTLYQGYSLTGLQPSTTYHVNAQSFDGSTWCTAPDATLTTLPLPNPHPAYPTPPEDWTISVPAVTGTVWTLGVNCGTGSPVDFQDCLNKANFGDEILLPAGLANAVTPVSGPDFYPPSASDATPATAIDRATGTFTVSSNPFANGQAVRLGSSYFIPSPLNIGNTYYVVNANATSFQVASSRQAHPSRFWIPA